MYKSILYSRYGNRTRISVSRYETPICPTDEFLTRYYFDVSVSSQQRFARLFTAHRPNFYDVAVVKGGITICAVYHPGYFSSVRKYKYPERAAIENLGRRPGRTDEIAMQEEHYRDVRSSVRGNGYWGEVGTHKGGLHLFLSKQGYSDMCISACFAIVADVAIVEAPISRRVCLVCLNSAAAAKNPYKVVENG